MRADHQYSEEDAEEILRLAAHKTGGGIDRRKLVEMAAELGIAPEAVSAAEAELAKRRQQEVLAKEEEALRREYRSAQFQELWGHLGGYVFVNAFLVGMWYFKSGGYFWPGWVLGAWGLGLLSTFISTVFRIGDYEADFKKWRKRRDKANRKARTESSVPLESVLDEIASLDLAKHQAIEQLRDRLSLSLHEAQDEVEAYTQKHPGVFR